VRLAPDDYHCFHLPVNCRIGPRIEVDGTLFSVSPKALTAVNVLGSNKRRVCFVDSKEFGLIALVVVGAVMVGSITILLEENSEHTKGDMHGMFKFGGSTVVVVFQEGRIQFDSDLLENSRSPIETKIMMGNRIGYATRPGDTYEYADRLQALLEEDRQHLEPVGQGVVDRDSHWVSKKED